MSPTSRRGTYAVASLLFALAGCSTGHDESPRMVGGGADARIATVSTSANEPGSYSMVDGKKEAIPAIKMGDSATISRIIDEGTNRNQVESHLEYISTKIGPRLTGSTNVDTANKWCRDQFEKWGLTIPAFASAKGQSGGDHNLRGLFQWNEVSARFDRGPSTGRLVARRNPADDQSEYRSIRDLEFTTPAWTAGTKGPVRGRVLKMPETDAEFEAMKDSIKGSWILVKPASGRRGIVATSSARIQMFAGIRKRWAAGGQGDEPQADKDITKYEGTMIGGPMTDATPFYLDVKLIDPKAVTGTVSIGGFRTTEIRDATYDADSHQLKFRTEGRANRDYVLTLDGETLKGETKLPDNGGTIQYTAKKVVEDTRKGPSMDEKVLALAPAGWISSSTNELVITGGMPGWDKLDVDTVTSDVVITVRQSDYECMNSRLADGQTVEAEFDLKHTFTKGPIPVYDTIAEIKGTEKPDEVIIVSGHLDSWNGPGSQGTTDNGTGSAVTLEAARILMAAKAKPKRTIRFILWTGEEQGLLGSAAYVRWLKESGKLDNVSAVLVDDGGTNYEGGLSCISSMVPYLAAATAPVNGRFYSETDEKFLDVNIRPQKVFTQISGSDHASFVREKIPGFFWDEVGRADYNHTHHTQHDHLAAAIPEYLRQSSTCAAVTAYNLACAPDKLPRPKEEEWQNAGRRGNSDGVGPGGSQRPGAGSTRPGTGN